MLRLKIRESGSKYGVYSLPCPIFHSSCGAVITHLSMRWASSAMSPGLTPLENWTIDVSFFPRLSESAKLRLCFWRCSLRAIADFWNKSRHWNLPRPVTSFRDDAKWLIKQDWTPDFGSCISQQKLVRDCFLQEASSKDQTCSAYGKILIKVLLALS